MPLSSSLSRLGSSIHSPNRESSAGRCDDVRPSGGIQAAKPFKRTHENFSLPFQTVFEEINSKLSVSHIKPAYSTRSLRRYRLTHLVCMSISAHSCVTPTCVLRYSWVTQGACGGTGGRLYLCLYEHLGTYASAK